MLAAGPPHRGAGLLWIFLRSFSEGKDVSESSRSLKDFIFQITNQLKNEKVQGTRSLIFYRTPEQSQSKVWSLRKQNSSWYFLSKLTDLLYCNFQLLLKCCLESLNDDFWYLIFDIDDNESCFL